MLKFKKKKLQMYSLYLFPLVQLGEYTSHFLSFYFTGSLYLALLFEMWNVSVAVWLSGLLLLAHIKIPAWVPNSGFSASCWYRSLEAVLPAQVSRFLHSHGDLHWGSWILSSAPVILGLTQQMGTFLSPGGWQAGCLCVPFYFISSHPFL